MIFKKDSFIFGTILGFFGPLLGIIIFKLTKFETVSFKETFHFMLFAANAHSLSSLLSTELFQTQSRISGISWPC